MSLPADTPRDDIEAFLASLAFRWRALGEEDHAQHQSDLAPFAHAS